MDKENKHWAWWASDGGEVYRVGPYASRKEVIKQAIAEELGWHEVPQEPSAEGAALTPPVLRLSFQICEAENPPLRLSDWLPDADYLLDHAEDQVADSDRVASECDEPPYFEGITPAQRADLEQSIKAAVNQWQERHGLVFTVRTFADMRNEETVTVILPPSI